MAAETPMAGETRPDAKPGPVIPHQPQWHARLAARLIQLIASAIALTLRSRFEDRSGCTTGRLQGPVIFAIWHNRLALSLIINRRYVMPTQPEHRLAALVSASKDGALLARVLELFGAQPVRGSSSRRGAQALIELNSCARKGLNIAITPDGPRGPKYKVQPGVISLAQTTGLPIVPVGYRLGWKLKLKSWDQFQIPLPFSTWDVTFGEPIRVPSDAADGEKERLRVELENRLNSLAQD